MRRARRTHPVMLTVLALAITACGGDSAETAPTLSPEVTPDTAAETSVPDTIVDDLEEMVEGLTESLQAQQDAHGGGSATLVVGDTTWTFAAVLCAFGEEEIGAEGAEFVLSSLQDGLQLYVSIDSFGHSIDLQDIQDFDDPSVSLTADSFSAAVTGGAEEFVRLDGKQVRATANFVDYHADDLTPVEGTLEATCP